MPSEVGPALDAANRGLAVLPDGEDRLAADRDVTGGGWIGPGAAAPGRLGTTNVAQGFQDNLPQVNDIIANSAPILDSQVQSGDAIEQWARNLNTIAAQSAAAGSGVCAAVCSRPRPTLDAVTAVFSDVRDSLPQTLANLEIVIDMLKRYHKGLEQTLVLLPQGAAVAQAGTLFENDGSAALRRCRSTSRRRASPGFLPASEWRSPADTSMPAPLPTGTYCKIPKDYQGNVVRGARNYPCVDVPGKRAATPRSAAATSRISSAGYQPVVRRPEPDRCQLPCARRRAATSRPTPATSFRHRRSTTG